MAKKENTIPTIIDTPEALTAKIAAMKEAQKIFATFTQEQVDKIFKAAAIAANKARIPLAKMAVEETGMGIVEDKVIKNNYAAEHIYNKYKNVQTCGVFEENKAYGTMRIYDPQCGMVITDFKAYAKRFSLVYGISILRVDNLRGNPHYVSGATKKRQ